ncbi:MAG: biosynthetic-type acetolactate synthase large subunit [Lachnospiraceae bacterium]|nr:biosynthetic-type acetolactate synthase large subunit [Lachnospiraceae bacterium]
MDITGRKLFVRALQEEGVDTLFAYPGGMINELTDELYKADSIRVVLGRHEQGVVHEAEGYSRETGRTGVVLVTSGPGATNTITAIADAHYDSTPLVVFTGQVPQNLIGNDAFQEVDIVGMTHSVVKYGVTVRNRDDLGKIIKMAFFIASTGRPGPVLIDIPKDIQIQSGSSEYPETVDIRGYKPISGVHIGQLKKAYKLLAQAERPMILAGGGINIGHANEALTEFVHKMGLPVVTTIMGRGAIPTDDPYFIGNLGLHGSFASNKAVSACDVLFSIGTRFNDRITGDLNEFAPHAKIIHVDIDTSSISRNVVVDVPVVSDAITALEKLMEWAKPLQIQSWIEKINRIKAEFPLDMKKKKETLCPETIIDGINNCFKEATVVTDVGQHQMWTSQFLAMRKGTKLITSGGLGTMGFGLPAAIGAKIADPDRCVICITGDGGMQMNMQEMATAVTNDVAVIICIFNNQYLGMVRQQQQLFYGKRYEITCLRRRSGCSQDCKGPSDACPPYVPDYVKWADSYGVSAVRVESEEAIIPAFEQAEKVTKSQKIPFLIEFMISSDELVLPMVKNGSPISDMIL